MKRSLFLTIGIIIILGLVALQLFPVVIVFLTALRKPVSLLQHGLLSLDGLSLENFLKLFSEQSFLPALLSSTMVSLSAALMSVSLSSSLVFACTKFRFRLASPVLLALICSRLVPPAALILPLFILLKQFSLTDSHLGLVLAHTAINLPFCVWLLVPFFRALPLELGQAAEVDGLNPFQTLRLIYLPLLAPGLVVTMIFSFLMSWNDFLLSLVLAGSVVKTAPLLVNGFMTGFGTEWGSMAAASVVMLLPVFLFSLFLQKRLVAGLVTGGVK